jgi:hypothetical protein
MCMFNVVVRSRCRQMYAVSPSNDTGGEELDQCWLSGRSEQTRVRSPKTDRPHTRASVSMRTVISEACTPTLSVLVEGGMGMAVCKVFETVRCRASTYCVVVTRSSLTSSIYIHVQREANGQ